MKVRETSLWRLRFVHLGDAGQEANGSVDMWLNGGEVGGALPSRHYGDREMDHVTADAPVTRDRIKNPGPSRRGH